MIESKVCQALIFPFTVWLIRKSDLLFKNALQITHGHLAPRITKEELA
jgi:hypothetical protein